MALTAIERQLAKFYLKYYAGEIINTPADETKIELFLDADDATKKTILKTFA